jgi:carboxylesterase type B
VDQSIGSALYWISTSHKAGFCYAIKTNGTLTTVPCGTVYSALCTQSAPISSSARADASIKYQLIVATGSQNITGFRDFHSFYFQGIRIAPQPERFTFATLYEGNGHVDATPYAPACIQGPDARWPVLSEDCLFPNVWTLFLTSSSNASATKGRLKAVMFWIYGGGFTAGGGNDPEKDGTNMASRGDVVVVAFNYRLGNLGLLPFNDGVYNGNYAVSDMLTTLPWVNKNIANFGGGPKCVTIWGQPAGAVAARILLAALDAAPLIAGAIIQSMTSEWGVL